MAFSALKYADNLESVGFTREQAKVQANAIEAVMDSELATKRDIKELELKIAALEDRMVIKLGSLLLVGLGALVALSKLNVI